MATFKIYNQIECSVDGETGRLVSVSESAVSDGSSWEGREIGKGEKYRTLYYQAKGEAKKAAFNVFKRDNPLVYKWAKFGMEDDMRKWVERQVSMLPESEQEIKRSELAPIATMLETLQTRKIWKVSFKCPEGFVFRQQSINGEDSLMWKDVYELLPDGQVDITTLRREMRPVESDGFTFWMSESDEPDERKIIDAILKFGRFERS